MLSLAGAHSPSCPRTSCEEVCALNTKVLVVQHRGLAKAKDLEGPRAEARLQWWWCNLLILDAGARRVELVQGEGW